ncbi:MAG: protein kinase [Deltaproteobacteria bacterium]|nr:protein kinase [Deltaproteobacteria bacterium]
MNALLTSLELAPELTLEDLRDIKIPLDLLPMIPIEFCRKNKILPLRLESQSGILSFVFVDANSGAELENIRAKNGWTRLSAFRISDHAFQTLLNQVEKARSEVTGAETAAQGWMVALIESDDDLQASMKALLKSQGYQVLHFKTENEFKIHLKEIAERFKDEEDLLNIAETQKLVPYQAILVREKNLKTPKTFCETVWAHLSHMRISILEDRWLHRILERSQTSSKSSTDDFEFHLRHEDFYHAALECLKQGNLFQAVELLEQVSPENLYFIKSKIILGKAFLKKKNYNKASIHFQKAFDHWCEDPDAIVDETVLKLLYHLAYTFEKLNRFEDSLKLYERVAGENPLFKEVGARMARVKELQRKANSANEKKMGLPAFSKSSRENSRYEKIEEIGRGGMGIVHRARDRVLGREVALKILNSHFKHDEKIVETFLREAKSLASLNHLHIVTIFDAGIEEGNYYISMEFIEGKTVRDLLKKKGHFRIPTTLALSRQVLKALAYAHSKRVIHRDITTNNMMLTETKIIKLMDFGLARVVNQLHSEQSIIGGTPYFMSPEQVEGAPIDHRTDIYSFGVCLFEMLSGQVPFPMENPGYHHLHTTAPDVRTIKPDLNEGLAKIIAKCLEKKPDDRFQSADEIFEALKKIPEDSEPTLLVTPKKGKKK